MCDCQTSSKISSVAEPHSHDSGKCDSCSLAAGHKLTGHESARPRWRVTATIGGLFWLTSVVVWAIEGGTTTFLTIAFLFASTVVCGIPVVRTAWRAIRHFRLDMNVLMSMAAVGAFAIGEYFEAATAMFLFSVSLWLEAISMDRARRAVHSLVELTPTVAHRLQTGAEGVDGSTPILDAAALRDVDPQQLLVGDIILLRPGEMVPVDGTIIQGESALNQAAITGESLPVEKEPGGEVFAGSLNGEGSLWVRTDRAAESSTLARIARLVEQAQAARSPTERFIDRFAARYTPLVIGMAVFMALGIPFLGTLGWSWAASISPQEWFSRALVLLVIACPCALVISTPVTVVCGLYQAARQGILIKGGQYLETAGRLRSIAFDKTGTLTRGRPEVIGIEPAAGYTAEDVLAAAAALESHSEHPLAKAIVAEARRRGLELDEASDFSAMRGFGVRGKLRNETFFVGSPRMFADENYADGAFGTKRAMHLDGGSTLAVVATANSFWGTIRIADRPREEAARAVADLKKLGLKSISMLTGDGAAVSRLIARQIGVDHFYSNLLPDEKVSRVREICEEFSPTAMVGDGVNDAPALAASQLGIALGAGSSDTALETADVAIVSNDLGHIGDLIRLGRQCRVILGQNITLALFIKAVVLAAAAFGAATLWMAVVADVGASMLVIANGMRLAGGRRAGKIASFKLPG